MCSEVGVSPDAVETDELTQQLFLNETEVDSFSSLTQLTDGSSLSALSNGMCPCVCGFLLVGINC